MKFKFQVKGRIPPFLNYCNNHYKEWIMKSSCVLLFLGFTSLQLLMARDGKGQRLSDMKITVEFKKETLKSAFSTIERMTDLRFAYNAEQVDKYKDISLQKGTYTIQSLLDFLLEGTTLNFRKINNKIIVYRKEEAAEVKPVLLNAFVENAADGGTVKGVVTNDKNEPVAGATITVAETGKATAANAGGEFLFADLKPGKYRLQVSAVGFRPLEKEVTVTNSQTTQVSLALVASNNALDEVVVTGYSKQSRRDVTGAVSTISADVIAQTPVTDVSSVLQGRVAGVTVDGQGGPGNEQVVRIRGIGTLGDNNPLYVIDGVQTTGGLNMINTNDIESITVLKDAASCAVFGARGSNGVIVITTKRGKTGAPKMEYNSYAGYELPIKSIKLVTPQQYADAYWGYLKNSGLNLSSALYGNGATPVLPDYFVSKKGSPTFAAVKEGDAIADPSLYNFSTYRIMKTNKQGTDWFKEVFDPALTQSHQLAVSGATDKSNYAVTFNYLDNKGILLYSYFKRYSIRANTEFKVTPWLRLGENLQFAYTQGNTVSGHTDQNIIADIYNTSPLLPVYDIRGNYTGTNGAPGELPGDNLLLSRVSSKNAKGYSARLFGSAYIEVEPVKNLVLQSKVTIDYAPYQNRLFQDTMPQVRFPVTSLKFSEFSGNSTEWRSTNKISYSVTIAGLHKINAFVAYEASEYNYRGLGSGSDSVFYNLPGFMVTSTGTGVRWQVSGNADKTTYVSQFGSLNYAFGDRYLASFTIRRDGTSRFTDLKRYGVFPSGSLGWRISGENFMQGARWVNDLKFRASLGTSGNDAIPSGLTVSQYYTNPAYTYYDLNGVNNAAMLGFALTQIGNPLLQWEVNKTVNLGFDGSFFNNRLSASFNWFNRKTDKLLYQPPVTALQGDADAPYQNIMNFTNKGIELELGYHPASKRKFNYDINVNLATYRNNVDYIDGKPETYILGGLYARSINLSRSAVGKPVGSFYGWEYDGMIQQGDSAGHFRFKDISGPNGKPDGKVDDNDRTYIGNPHPKLTYGLNVNLYYGNFDASVFFQGVYGNKIFNYWRAFTEWPGKLGAGSLDTWSPENVSGKLPVYSNKDLDDDRPSTFFVESGSYLRLKSLQIGYTFAKIKGINKLRVYAQGYNLLTITNYSGLDPEVNSGAPGSTGIDFGGRFPVAMKLLFGVNLSL